MYDIWHKRLGDTSLTSSQTVQSESAAAVRSPSESSAHQLQVSRLEDVPPTPIGSRHCAQLEAGYEC